MDREAVHGAPWTGADCSAMVAVGRLLRATNRDVRCNGARNLGKHARSIDRFEGEVIQRTRPSDRGARVTTLVRAAFSRDPNQQDWNVSFGPYDDGTATWEQTLDRVYTDPQFGAVVSDVCECDEPGYGFGASIPLDVLELTSGQPSRSQHQLQAEIDAHAAVGRRYVLFQPGEVIRVGGPANANRQLVVKSRRDGRRPPARPRLRIRPHGPARRRRAGRAPSAAGRPATT